MLLDASQPRDYVSKIIQLPGHKIVQEYGGKYKSIRFYLFSMGCNSDKWFSGFCSHLDIHLLSAFLHWSAPSGVAAPLITHFTNFCMHLSTHWFSSIASQLGEIGETINGETEDSFVSKEVCMIFDVDAECSPSKATTNAGTENIKHNASKKMSFFNIDLDITVPFKKKGFGGANYYGPFYAEKFNIL